MAFKLPELDYDYSALTPYFDSETMKTHHGKHHAAYVAKLNAAVENTEFATKTIEELLSNLDVLPDNIKGAVRNNGGGHANHSLFWTQLSATAQNTPKGDLLTAINSAFGGFDSFKETFSQAAATHFGSGWAWLVKTAQGQLAVYSLPNQDSPLMQGDIPLMGLDVWEHAYYLKYKNLRPSYIEAFWNVLDWKAVETEFAKA